MEERVKGPILETASYPLTCLLCPRTDSRVFRVCVKVRLPATEDLEGLGLPLSREDFPHLSATWAKTRTPQGLPEHTGQERSARSQVQTGRRDSQRSWRLQWWWQSWAEEEKVRGCGMCPGLTASSSLSHVLRSSLGIYPQLNQNRGLYLTIFQHLGSLSVSHQKQSPDRWHRLAPAWLDH